MLGITLPSKTYFFTSNFPTYETIRYDHDDDYLILIGSDKHNLPGHTPQAFKAFLHLVEGIKPDYVVLNGDLFDFPQISRHHRIGWAERPDLVEELQAGISCLKEIHELSPKSKRIFHFGNHDMRFNGWLSNCSPELEGIHGTALEDHFPDGWKIGMSSVFNETLIVKHRWHSGVHSGYNDVLRGGKNIATGHDHKLSVRPWTDYGGIRYGIKTGTLSDLWDDSFAYLENNSVDWQPGCVVITVSKNLIFPVACPIVIDRTHKHWGKLNYQGKWYG